MVRRSGWVGLVVVVAIATLAASAEAVTITLYRLPTPDSRIGGMTLGRGGDVWFTEIWGNKIGRLTPEGSIQEFEIPTPSSDPQDIAMGSDGNFWFTESRGNKIGTLTIDGAFAEYPLPSQGSDPFQIAAGPDGNLWFTELDNRIGRITTAGVITEYTTAGVIEPYGITSAKDGLLWFTVYGSGEIGSIDPSSGQISLYPILGYFPAPTGIAVGPDGNVWFVAGSFFGDDHGQLGRVSPNGAITNFPLPTSTAGPQDIVSSRGFLWFTEAVANQLGKATTGGAISEFGLPGKPGPTSIVSAISGRTMWVALPRSNTIAGLS